MQGFGGVSDVLIGSSRLLSIGAETLCRDNTVLGSVVFDYSLIDKVSIITQSIRDIDYR
jgi:hypothetical protein